MASKVSLTSLALGGAALNVGVRVGGVLLSIVSMSILARLLSPTEYGLFAVVVLFISTATVPSEAVSGAIVQHTVVKGNEVAGAFTLVVCVSVVMAAVGFLATGPIETLFHDVDLHPYRLVMFPLILLTALASFFDAVQGKLLKFKRVAVVDFVTQSLCQASVSIVLAYLGFGIWSLIWGLIVAAFLKVGIQLFMGMSQYARPKLVPARFVPAVTWFLALQLANLVGRNGDNAVVGVLLGPSALGIYGRSYNLMLRPVTTLGGVIVSVFYPLVSSISSDLPRVRSGYLKAVAIAALLALPASVFASIYAREIVIVLLGGRWLEATLPFQILAAALYFRLAYRVTETLTFSRGALGGATSRQAFYGLAVIVGAVVGAKFGIAGVALGVSLALAAFFVLSASFANRLSETSAIRFLDAHLPGAIIALSMAVVIIPLRAAVSSEWNPLITLAVGVAVAGIVFAAGIFIPALFHGSPIEELMRGLRARVTRHFA